MDKKTFNSLYTCEPCFETSDGNVWYFDYSDYKDAIIIGDAMQVANGYGAFCLHYNDELTFDENMYNVINIIEDYYQNEYEY